MDSIHDTIKGTLTRPPTGLIGSATLFFRLMGLTSFIQAAVRFRFARLNKRALADTLSGLALIAFSYLIALWNSRIVTFLSMLTFEFAVCGILLILYAVMLFTLFKKS